MLNNTVTDLLTDCCKLYGCKHVAHIKLTQMLHSHSSHSLVDSSHSLVDSACLTHPAVNLIHIEPLPQLG